LQSEPIPRQYATGEPHAGVQRRQASLATGRLSPNSYLSERYQILQKVGQGGMGAVYQALDTRITNRICAIKEMSDAALQDESERQQALYAFQREAELLSHLQHSNLPRVSDRFESGGKHYLVMEYIEGETLQKQLARGAAPFSEVQLCAWARELCDVLGYLHSQDPPIIFRDIKPDNIMIDRDGHVRLIDFGIVRFFKPGRNKDTTLLGTPGYASPEQYGSGQTDARSDVYSLGATLFHLATGHDPGSYPPYQLPPVRQLNPALSSAWEALISRAVHPHVSRRWQSMAEMAAAIPRTKQTERATTGPRLAATPGDATTRIEGRSARPTTRLLMQAARFSNRQLTVAGLLIVIALVGGTWLLTPYLREISWFWRNVPTIAVIAPLAYAATRRRWVTAIAQIGMALAGGAVVWMRLDASGDLAGLLIGALASGLVVEIMVALLPRISGSRQGNDTGAWQIEVVWLALTAVLGHIALSYPAIGPNYAFNVLAWISAAILGAFGWFIGDMIQGYLYLQQTGFRRRGGSQS
jgi:serine/threonine protein kinase